MLCSAPASSCFWRAKQASPLPPYRGTMGSAIWEGYGALCKIVCNAGLSSAGSAIRFPVLGFRSKRGKLLLDTSILIRCPALKTLLVAHRSIVQPYALPGSTRLGADVDSR